jgi:hypothetical protein
MIEEISASDQTLASRGDLVDRLKPQFKYEVPTRSSLRFDTSLFGLYSSLSRSQIHYSQQILQLHQFTVHLSINPFLKSRPTQIIATVKVTG